MATITLTQQSVSLVRQIVNAIGWAKGVEDIAIGGEILLDVLPATDSLGWIKTEEEVKEMTEEQRIAYVAQDKVWVEKTYDISFTPAQIAVVSKAFTYNADELAKEGKLGPSRFFTEIIKAFEIKSVGSKA